MNDNDHLDYLTTRQNACAPNPNKGNISTKTFSKLVLYNFLCSVNTYQSLLFVVSIKLIMTFSVSTVV